MPSPDPPLPKRKRAPGDTPKESLKSEVPSPANDAGEMLFGGKSCRLDFPSWAALSHWEPHEAACLSCGVDPRSFPRPGEETPWPFDELADRVWFRTQAIRRAVDSGRLDRFVSPLDALNVLDDIRAEYSPELRQAAEVARPFRSLTNRGRRNPRQVLKAKAEVGVIDHATGEFLETTPSQTKVIATLYKIIIALAVHSHGFRPERPTNPTAGRLHPIVSKYFKMDVDTIRTHLKIGAEAHWHERLK